MPNSSLKDEVEILAMDIFNQYMDYKGTAFASVVRDLNKFKEKIQQETRDAVRKETLQKVVTTIKNL